MAGNYSNDLNISSVGQLRYSSSWKHLVLSFIYGVLKGLNFNFGDKMVTGKIFPCWIVFFKKVSRKKVTRMIFRLDYDTLIVVIYNTDELNIMSHANDHTIKFSHTHDT